MIVNGTPCSIALNLATDSRGDLGQAVYAEMDTRRIVLAKWPSCPDRRRSTRRSRRRSRGLPGTLAISLPVASLFT